MTIRKTVIAALLIILPVAVLAQKSGFYNFKVRTLEGTDFDLGSLKGKKVMAVNTASKCGYTPQYKDLEELFKR